MFKEVIKNTPIILILMITVTAEAIGSSKSMPEGSFKVLQDVQALTQKTMNIQKEAMQKQLNAQCPLVSLEELRNLTKKMIRPGTVFYVNGSKAPWEFKEPFTGEIDQYVDLNGAKPRGVWTPYAYNVTFESPKLQESKVDQAQKVLSCTYRLNASYTAVEYNAVGDDTQYKASGTKLFTLISRQ